VVVESGKAQLLYGSMPDADLHATVMNWSASPIQPLTEADGDAWLMAMSKRYQGYLWGIYFPTRDEIPPAREWSVGDIEARVAEMDAERWKNPDDAGKHPKWPSGAEGGKGGQWAPKNTGLTSWQVMSDEAQRTREALLHGDISNLVALSDVGVTGGIHEDDCAVATVGTVKVFIKRGYDAPGEVAASIVNHMLSNGSRPFIQMPEVVGRKFDWSTDEKVIKGDKQWNDRLQFTLTPVDNPKETVSFANFIDGVSADEAQYMDSESLYELAVFDSLIGNTDRHEFNVMVNRRGVVQPVDHGFAFTTYVGGGENWAGRHYVAEESDGAILDRRLQNHRLHLDWYEKDAIDRFIARAKTKAGKKALTEYLDIEQYKALLGRAQYMSETGQTYGYFR
jgi:hypothetical protein